MPDSGEGIEITHRPPTGRGLGEPTSLQLHPTWGCSDAPLLRSRRYTRRERPQPKPAAGTFGSFDPPLGDT